MNSSITPSFEPRALEAPSGMRTVSERDGLSQLWTALLRQRIPVLTSLVVALAIGLLAVMLLPKTYTATSSVQLEQQTPQVITAPGLDPEPEDANRFLQTQLDRVQSRTLAQQVSDMLAIQQSPELLTGLGLDGAAEDDILIALRENVLAELGLNTRLARISFVSRDPEVSARIANAYADALVEDNLRGKVETSTKAQDYLLEQLDEAKRKLEESERRMLSYARSADLTGTTSADGVSSASIPSRQIDELTASLAAATARRIDAQQEWGQIRNVPPATLSQVQENRAYQELLAEKAQLQAALAQDRQRRTDEYPTVAAALVQIEELDNEISSLARNIKQSFYQRYQAAARQEAQLKATIDQLRNAAIAEQERGVGYNSLQREVETNRMSYDGLLQRYREVSAASGAPSANVMLVDRAEPPLEPSSPKWTWIMALATVLGLIAGMAIGLLRELMDRKIRSVEDLESTVDLAVLGVVPVLDRGSAMTDALRNIHSPQSEAYKSVAASLQQQGERSMPKTILLTSTHENEGKSTSTLGLARALHTLGFSVLVINGDLRHPSPDAGLAETLEGNLDPKSVVRINERAGLAIMQSGKAEGDLVGLLTPDKIKPVIGKLSEIADITLIDGPPIMGLADAVLLAGSVDTVLMVVAANRTEPNELETALSRLPPSVPAAAILTKFDAREAGTSYGSAQYYTYGKPEWVAQRI